MFTHLTTFVPHRLDEPPADLASLACAVVELRKEVRARDDQMTKFLMMRLTAISRSIASLTHKSEPVTAHIHGDSRSEGDLEGASSLRFPKR